MGVYGVFPIPMIIMLLMQKMQNCSFSKDHKICLCLGDSRGFKKEGMKEDVEHGRKTKEEGEEEAEKRNIYDNV